MKRIARLRALLGLLLLAGAPLWAQWTPIQGGGSPVAAVPAGLGQNFEANVLGTMNQFFPDLRVDIGPGLDSLKASILSEQDPEKRGSLLLVYDSLRKAPAEQGSNPLSGKLPKSLSERIAEVAAHVRKNPELARRVAEDLSLSVAAAPQTAPATAPAPSAALAAARNSIHGTLGAPAASPAVPAVAWNGQEFPAVIFPNDGTDPLAHWLNAHQQSDGLHQANYNFDLLEMAQSMVDQSKKGRPQVLIGDFSNWFPKQSPPADQDLKSLAVTPDPAPGRSAAMELILQNLGPNLKLFITKGLSSIGIQHNKFSRFTSRGGAVLGQGGSANYSETSFTPKTLTHWENVYFYADKAMTDLDELYFQWLLRHAKPFSEDLTAKDVEPVFDPKDPIPVDPKPSVSFGGKLFPINTFSPNGGTEDWLVLAQSLSDAGVDILMFSPFPTQRMQDGLMALLKAGKAVRLLADRGQAHNALPHLTDLIAAGMQMKVLSGPDPDTDDIHQKMHNKIMRFKRTDGDGLLKRGSLNISENALTHNFENNPFTNDPATIRLYDDYFEMLWSKGQPPSQDFITRPKPKAKAKV